MMAQDFRGAETSFRRAIVLSPSSAACHDDWLHLLQTAQAWLSVVKWSRRRLAIQFDLNELRDQAKGLLRLDAVDAARRLLHRITALSPSLAEIWILLGEDAERRQKIKEACQTYERAWRIDPQCGGALGKLIRTLTDSGQADVAIRRFSLISEDPAASVDLLSALAFSYLAVEATSEAEALFRESARSAPENLNASIWLAQAAGLAMARGDVALAAIDMRCVVVLVPADAMAWGNLSETIRGDNPKFALCWGRRSVTIDLTGAEAWGNIALAYYALEEFTDVERTARRALVLAPNLASTLVNLSHWTNLSDRQIEAERWARRALALDPGNPGITVNLGFALLTQGRVEEGYRLQEARFLMPGSSSGSDLRIKRPRWRGESLSGRSLLVWREQGLGDQFFFARYLAMMPTTDGHVVIECDPRVTPLFQRSFPLFTAVAERPTVEATIGGLAIDLQIPITSLPLAFLDRTRAAIDAARAGRPWPTVRYFLADSEKVAIWRGFPSKRPGRFRLGISWRSAALTATTAPHYMDVKTIARVLKDLPITVINIQYSYRDDEVAFLAATLDDFINPPINLKDDLEDVAAILAGCDLVLAPLTAAMYLAAGLGIPSWNFMIGRSWSTHGLCEQPLFPHMRSFSRSPVESWDRVVASIRQALIDMLDRQ